MRPTIIWGPRHPAFADAIFRHPASGKYVHPRGDEPIVRAFGYVRNVAAQMLCFATLPPGRTNRHISDLGDGAIDDDLWADAFSQGPAGRPARRIPLRRPKLLGRVGDVLRRIGLAAPIDSGRAFRMSTSSRVDLAATHAITGPGQVSFDEGVRETLQWLYQVDPRRFAGAASAIGA